MLKKVLIAILTLFLAVGCLKDYAYTIPNTFFKPNSFITWSQMTWMCPCNGWTWNAVYFQCTLSEANSVDYRVVVGCWIYQQGFYYVGSRKIYGWYWGWRYYSMIIPAGYTSKDNEFEIWMLNDGEQCDQNNYYISYYGPN